MRRDRADRHDAGRPRQVVAVHRHRQRLGRVEVEPWDHTGHDRGDQDVNHGRDDQRPDDAARKVTTRIACLLGRRGDGVEADVGEEDDRRPGPDAVPPVGQERLPVGGLHVVEAHDDEERQHDQLDQHHRRVEARGLLHADHQHPGEKQHDGRCGRLVMIGTPRDVGRRGHDLGRRQPGSQIGGAATGGSRCRPRAAFRRSSPTRKWRPRRCPPHTR